MKTRLDAAKRAWLRARDDYDITEIYRFYDGPIDNLEGGPEGLNAWPLDESYIDYVDGDANAGVINKPGEFPTIDTTCCQSAKVGHFETREGYCYEEWRASSLRVLL